MEEHYFITADPEDKALVEAARLATYMCLTDKESKYVSNEEPPVKFHYGQESVVSPSNIDKVENMFFPLIPIFVLELSSTKEALKEASLPVPAVVGIQIVGIPFF